MSLTAGQSCSYEAPYNQICGNGLSCDQCPENTGYSCQNAAPTPGMFLNRGTVKITWTIYHFQGIFKITAEPCRR